MPSSFPESAFSIDRLAALRESMHAALVEDGLFPDEATAMLKTWEASYFRAPGLRLFFLVPQAWTERVLPLHLSVPATVTCVMVGRIEIVTPQQHAFVQQLAEGPVPTKPFDEMPTTYRDLGRFRNALILNQAAHRSTQALRAFVGLNHIERDRAPPGLQQVGN
jgi:hypothetical protein